MPEIVREPVVILYSAIDAIVEGDDLLCIKMDPPYLRCRLPLCSTKSFAMEFLDEFISWGRHDDF